LRDRVGYSDHVRFGGYFPVDDESDVEMLFRQQFRRDLRSGRFTMEFAQSVDSALQRISDAAGASLILFLSDINMPGMSGLELLPKAKALRPDVPVIMITAYGDDQTKRKALEGGAEVCCIHKHRMSLTSSHRFPHAVVLTIYESTVVSIASTILRQGPVSALQQS
jgi:CheY-like chemotaxis protein